MQNLSSAGKVCQEWRQDSDGFIHKHSYSVNYAQCVWEDVACLVDSLPQPCPKLVALCGTIFEGLCCAQEDTLWEDAESYAKYGAPCGRTRPTS